MDHINAISEINSMLKSTHNEKLVDNTKQPNDNEIYKIWQDGSITREKGGWAYGSRSVFEIMYPINIKHADKLIFPLKCNELGYAITTYEDAVRIRTLIMENLVL